MRTGAAVSWLIGAALAAIVLFAPRPAFALEPDIDLHQVLHRSWSVVEDSHQIGNSARPPVGVRVFVQAPDGRFWLGGATGLQLFDGVVWELDAIGPEALSANSITAACTASDGAVWLGFEAGGVVRATPQHNDAFSGREGPPQGTVRQLVCTPSGRVLAATNTGLALWQTGRWSDVTREWGLPPGATVLAVAAAADGTIWAMTENALLRRGAADPLFRNLLTLRASAAGGAQIATGSDGGIWIGTAEEGLLHLPPGGNADSVQHLSGIPVSALLIDRDGCVWFGGQGLRRMCSHGDIQSMQHTEGLSANDVRALFQDHDGSIWAATELGIDQFARGVFVKTRTPQEFDGDKALVAGNDDELWVGDRSHGIVMHLLADKLVATVAVPTPEIGYRDTAGQIWFAGTQGLSRVASAGTKTWPLPLDARGGKPLAIVQYPDGALWVSIAPQGVFRFNDGLWNRVNGSIGLPDGPANAMDRTDDGSLWLGYANGDLVRVRGHEVRTFAKKDGIQSGLIQALSAKGPHLWIAGDKAVTLWDQGHFYNGRRTNCGLSGPAVGVVEATLGDVWLNRPQQFGVSPDAVNLIKADRSLDCTPFRSDDGLPGIVETHAGGPAMAITATGRVWVAAGGMLAWTNAARESDSLAAPTITVNGFQAKSGFRRALGTEPFPAGVRDLLVTFHVWRLSKPTEERIRYRVMGIDPDWTTLSRDSRFLNLMNLGPGRYVLEMQAQYPRQHAWGPVSATPFAILPQFYQTVWFRAVLIALAAAMAAILFRVQLLRANARTRERIEARMLERERIARELHDTLLQGLQGLIFNFQAVANRMSGTDPASALLKQAIDRADEILVESRERVSELRTDASHSMDLPTALEEVATHLAADRGPEIRTQILGRAQPIDATVYAEVFLIAREAVTNAIRHARATLVTIMVNYDGRFLRLTIQDDGEGISPEILEAGGRQGHFGMRGMHERTRRLRGGLNITRQMPRGTQVELWVPAAVAYAIRGPR